MDIASDSPALDTATRKREVARRSTAESMATKQRDISVSEFFAKNKHLLGFDNPRKALLTTVKEAVDNSLDACEEAGIVPEIWVELECTEPGRYRVSVQDNGPGIVKKQIPLIFGKLLYGSKFHRLRMSRGQQGIGISAAGMNGMLTTGKPMKIISKTVPINRCTTSSCKSIRRRIALRSSMVRAKALIFLLARRAWIIFANKKSVGIPISRQ